MKFSVIVPYFKESCEIRNECRSSIENAIKKANIEAEIIEEFGDDGVSIARNRAIAKSNGDWLVFVDADDVVSTDYFCEIKKAIERNPMAQLIAWGDNYGASLWSGLWNKAYRRDILPVEYFRPYSHGEDRLFIASVLSKSPIIEKIHKKLYFYRPSANSVTNRFRDARWILDTIGYSTEMLDILNKMQSAPRRLYHDIAVWTLEECAYAMRKMSQMDQETVLQEWLGFVKCICQNNRFSIWHRLVSFMVVYGGWCARELFCCFPRVLKRKFAFLVAQLDE